jgi:hypothetical protein
MTSQKRMMDRQSGSARSATSAEAFPPTWTWRIGVQAAIRHAHPTKQSFHPAAESGSGSSVSELNGIRQSLDLDNPKTADKCLSRQNA